MKRLITILTLLFVLSFSGSGISLVFHFCHNLVTSLEIYPFSFNERSCECGPENEDAENCCSTKIITLLVTDSIIKSSNIFLNISEHNSFSEFITNFLSHLSCSLITTPYSAFFKFLKIPVFIFIHLILV